MHKNVLVTYASRSGSTQEVAEAISKFLQGQTIQTTVLSSADVNNLKGYTAAIIGSPIQRGNWLPEIVSFLDVFKEDLAKLPIAYFMICLTMSNDNKEARRTALGYLEPINKRFPQLKPLEIGLFGGVMDFTKLSAAERMIMEERQVQQGDYRNWEAICTWTDKVRQKFFFED